METKNDLPICFFASQQEWEAWLEAHQTSQGVWIKLAKKRSGITSVTHAEALDVAICYGWIDGQSASLDDQYGLRKFTPRRPRSKWSQVNCEKATAFIDAGRMKEAGLREVEAAKRDGRWDRAYASQRTMGVPDDLQEQLDARPEAQAFFASLGSKNRYAILYRIQDAKKPETRARRIDKLVAMLEAK